MLLLVLVGFLAYVDFSLKREDALPADGNRPADGPGTNWLLVGSDSRDGLDAERQAELGTGGVAGRRTDTVVLVHIPEGDGKPTMVSLPRDSYVPIPGH
ncbi:MAG: LCP family protein, partial [Saccharopolyspora rectivirgula]